MNIVLWVLAIILAAAFLAAGGFKLVRTREQLIAAGLGWVESYPTGAVKLIAGLEVLAAIGLILPPALDIAPVLAPLAATGLAVIMVGALITHGRRKESQPIVANVVLLVLAVVVAWGRFGPYHF